MAQQAAQQVELLEGERLELDPAAVDGVRTVVQLKGSELQPAPRSRRQVDAGQLAQDLPTVIRTGHHRRGAGHQGGAHPFLLAGFHPDEDRGCSMAPHGADDLGGGQVGQRRSDDHHLRR